MARKARWSSLLRLKFSSLSASMNHPPQSGVSSYLLANPFSQKASMGFARWISHGCDGLCRDPREGFSLESPYSGHRTKR